MTPKVFECSVVNRWAEMAARLGVGLLGVALVVWGVSHGSSGLGVAATLLGGPFFWVVACHGWRTAWRVSVSDQHIEGARIGARPVRLTWAGVGEVQHFVRETSRGPIRLLRLLSIDRQREIVFTDRLPRFEELMRMVEAAIRHVSTEDSPAWGHFLWVPAHVKGHDERPSPPGTAS
jgi:hypothetical protein